MTVNNDKEPFNLYLLPTDRSAITGLLPVTSLNIFLTGTEFHPNGLYSDVIFGPAGDKLRQRRFSFIDIRTEIMHPKIFFDLVKLKQLYLGIFSGTTYAIWDEKKKDFVKSDIIDGKTGYSFFLSHFTEINFEHNASDSRDLRINSLDKLKHQCMYRYVQVIPAGLRDIEIDDPGHPTEDEINQLYRNILKAANTISIYNSENNSASLDNVRWNLQKSFNAVYQHLEKVVSGKRGFLLSKVAARNIHASTRNVITAGDPAPLRLGSPEAINLNHTVVGLHQYLKSISSLAIYYIRTGPMQPVVTFLPNVCYVVDKRTLTRKQIEPDSKLIDSWGTEAGIEKFINGFGKLTARHSYVRINNDDYAALIYKDDKVFKVFYDINELPKHFNKANVSPMTWAEMFYISVYQSAKRIPATNTRYPIASRGSIYASKSYLTTTTETKSLMPLDSNWHPITDETVKAISFPVDGLPFFDSLSPHFSHYPEMNADNDGDKTTFTALTAEESIKEVDETLRNKTTYLNPDGSLRYGINNLVSSMVLHSMTCGKV